MAEIEIVFLPQEDTIQLVIYNGSKKFNVT